MSFRFEIICEISQIRNLCVALFFVLNANAFNVHVMGYLF